MSRTATAYTNCTQIFTLIAVLIFTLAGGAFATTFLPPDSSSTKWSVAADHKTIMLSVNGDTPAPFVIKGVDYSPRPINDAALTEPGSDYFWGDPANLTYSPIWIRDVWGTTYNSGSRKFPDGLVRQLGANSVRTYAWWKWVPMTTADYAKWRDLDWSVSPRVRFGATNAPSGFAKWPAHDGGDQFLDLCWNNGVNPIYVVIGLALDPWIAFPGTNPDHASMRDQRAFIEHTTRWLAQRYGYHPAVLGFAIGNETNMPLPHGTDQYLDYWQYLNRLGAIAKRYAPNKLTMTAFADYPPPEPPMLLKPLLAFKEAADERPGSPTVPVCVDRDGANPGPKCVGSHRRPAYPADIYGLDVWGFNAYRRPESEDVANFRHWVIEGRYTNGAATGNAPPNPMPRPIVLTEWGAPASIRTRDGQPPPPPNPQWVTASPAIADEFHGAPGYRAAKLIQEIATDMYRPRSTLSTTGGGILSGGYVFEFQDEWWKEAQRRPETWSSHDTTTLTNKFPFGEPPGGFASFWDEEWFGLMSVATGAGRRPNSSVLFTAEHGGRSLNGGADVLTPRAGFYALQDAFKGTASTPEPIVDRTKLIRISLPPRAHAIIP